MLHLDESWLNFYLLVYDVMSNVWKGSYCLQLVEVNFELRPIVVFLYLSFKEIKLFLKQKLMYTGLLNIFGTWNLLVYMYVICWMRIFS